MTDSRPVTTTTKDSPEPGATPSGTTAPPEPAASHGGPDATGTTRPRVHFPGLEGLRALAAVMVVVHHAVATAGPGRTGLLWTPAAVFDAGVAIFFVLSGFLIYRPYAAAHNERRKPLRAASFWWRRLLRIVPAYWLVLTFFWKVLPTYELGDQWWRYYLFLQIYSRDYTLGGIVQAWSLCTEVSFYLVIPLWAVAMGWISKRVKGVYVDLAGCAALGLLGVGFRKWATAHWSDPATRPPTFQWLPANIDLFAVGMTIAVLSVWASQDGRLQRLADRVFAWAEVWWALGIGIFVWYAYRVGGVDPVAGYAGFEWQQRQVIVAAVAACLLLPAVFGDQRQGVIRKGLLLRPVVWVGMVSYGLYLWHFDWMKRSVDRSGGGGLVTQGWFNTPELNSNVIKLLAVGLGMGLLCAAISWYALEKPLQRFKRLI